jgi:hypothetical protein
VIWGPFAIRRVWRDPAHTRRTAIGLGAVVLASQAVALVPSIWSVILSSSALRWTQMIAYVRGQLWSTVLVLAIFAALFCPPRAQVWVGR